MAGKRKEGVYSIRELSPEVRKKVLDRWRYEIWDQNDSDQLSEDFEQILSERGMSNPKVYWSLSGCQGDGVAFQGNLDARDFFTWIFSGEKQAKPLVQEAKKFVQIQDLVGIKITHHGNYYHSNSMDVEIEVTGDEMDLVPEKYREEVKDWYLQKKENDERWQQTLRNIEWQKNAPIREWNRKMDERSKLISRGPKEWRPGVGPRPEPLDIPIPPEPMIRAPIRIQRMIDQAFKTFTEIDSLVNDLEKFIKEWTRDTSHELEEIGNTEIEYRQNDDAIVEFLEANEYEFDEEGEEI